MYFDGLENTCPKYCDIEGFNPDDCECTAGIGCDQSIDVDPLFVDPDGDDDVLLTYRDNDYQLLCYSPCVDGGDPTVGVIPTDFFDVDFDNMGNPDTEPTPDLALHDLRVQDGGLAKSDVDIGAYEVDQLTPPACAWDCEPTPDGDVGINDFLQLLAEWTLSCHLDSARCDHLGPGGVGMEDFLALLAVWGPCSDPGSEGPIQSVQDCIDRFGAQQVVLEECMCRIDPCYPICPPDPTCN